MLEDYTPDEVKDLETTFTVGSLNHSKNDVRAISNFSSVACTSCCRITA